MKPRHSTPAIAFRYFKLFTVLLVLLVASCKKEEEESFEIRMESILTTSYDYSVVTGNMVEMSVSAVDQHGFCYGLSENPTLSDNFTSLGILANTGLFRDTITNLTPGTTYHIRAYAMLSGQAQYSEGKTFTTQSLETPSMYTLIASGITTESAVVGGEILDNGGSSVTKRGICWNTTGNPTVGDHVMLIEGSGANFSQELTGLTCNTIHWPPCSPRMPPERPMAGGLHDPGNVWWAPRRCSQGKLGTSPLREPRSEVR
ncbi:MAG: hypothetical protein R2751_09970 [Bacteroidales bacterium]